MLSLTAAVLLSALVLTESSVLMQDESRSMGEVAIDMDSQSNPMQLQLIDEQVRLYLCLVLNTFFKTCGWPLCRDAVLQVFLI